MTPDRILESEFFPTLAQATRGAPLIAVVVPLNFPGIEEGGEIAALVRRFTATAVEAVTEAGGLPHIIDPSAEIPAPIEHLDDMAGAVFLGGGDLDPTLYGHTESVPNSYGVDRNTDDYSIAAITRLIDRDAPVLAICRGSQLLNVALGGDLVPDLDPWQLHRGGPDQPMFLDEEVELEPDSFVGRLYGTPRLTVRSGHHQAVAHLGKGLRVTARAHDGVIEGTELTERSWVVGVQWHPEDSDGSSENRTAIFAELVRRSADARG